MNIPYGYTDMYFSKTTSMWFRFVCQLYADLYADKKNVLLQKFCSYSDIRAHNSVLQIIIANLSVVP